MIIYNVTLKVDNDVTDKWVQWMKAEHLPDLMNTGLFIDCQLCRLLEQDDTDGKTYTAQYRCNNMDAYNSYIENHAQAMRDKAAALFGGKFVAFRSVMEVL